MKISKSCAFAAFLLFMLAGSGTAEAKTVYQWKCEPAEHSRGIGGCQDLAVTYKADEFPPRKGCRGQSKRSHNWVLLNTVTEADTEDDPDMGALQAALETERQKNMLLAAELKSLQNELQAEREKNRLLEEKLDN